MPKTVTKKNSKRTRAKLSDIPNSKLHTYSTVSKIPPQITRQCILHASTHATIVSSAAANVNTPYFFSLTASGINTGTWDQYRIECIRFSIIPDTNAQPIYTTASESIVPLYMVIDHDDATSIGTVAGMLQYSSCVVLGPNESAQRTFQPRMALAAYSGAFASYANSAPMWIDVVSPGVQHYGVKIFVPSNTAAQTFLQSWQVVAEYWVSFRDSI